MSERSTRLSRRQFLAATGATTIGATAGCLSAPQNSATTDVPDGVEQPDAWEGSDATAVETDYPFTTTPEAVDLDEKGGKVTMDTVTCRHQLLGENASGGPWELPEVWAWKTEDTKPSVPGPLLRITEGTELELTLRNSHNRPHTFHVHGVDKDWKDDGAPATTGVQVNPEEEHTYTLRLETAGTHFYHCHYQTQNHMDMGMYGILRVDPVDYEPPDKEFFLTLREWDTRLSASMAGGDVSFSQRDRTPDAFTINGRCAPYTLHPEAGSPLIVQEGDRVQVHLVNAGYESHAIHTHNHRFQVVEKDGGTVPRSAQYSEDVTDIAPAERKTIEFTADADPGLYPLHCHKVNHVMNGERYPGGMLTGIAYESALDTEQFAGLMDKAGFEPE